MAAIVFLLTAFILGYALTKSIFPKVSGFVRGTSEYFLLIPMWFYLGIIPITWAVYILAALLVDKVKGNVLLPANAIAIGLSLVISKEVGYFFSLSSLYQLIYLSTSFNEFFALLGLL